MNKVPILFTSKTCGACIQQLNLLSDYFKGKSVNIMTVDVDKHNVPFIHFTPTWYVPNKKGSYNVYNSIINNTKDFDKLVFKESAFGKKRRCRFGKDTSYLPQMGNWAKYGRNFPDGGGFNMPNSFNKDITNKWGTGNSALVCGTLGRELGPGNFNNVLSNEYVNNIRMAQPNDQLGTELYLNRSCNIQRNLNKSDPGMIYDSLNPQIVPMSTGFGKKRRTQVSKFGNYLYSQMGPAYGNQYLITKDTVKELYGGALNNNNVRPSGVQNKNIYIGKAPVYNPLNDFGKRKTKVKKTVCVKKCVKKDKVCVKKGKVCVKKTICVKKCKVGEGSVLTIKGNKVRVKRAN